MRNGIVYVTIKMIARREYIDAAGRCPFRKWFSGLNDPAASKVTMALNRLSNGNTSNVKFLGGGIGELKIDFGPGYRVYFGRDGDELIILLGGGTKKRQQEDIERARLRWMDYRCRKQIGG